MGTRIPKKGTTTKSKTSAPQRHGLLDALFSTTQQKVLGLVFGQPEREFGTLELIRLVDAGRGGVQRELARLAESGLVRVTDAAGGQRRYRANADAPIFHELQSIIHKTAGVPSVLRRVLQPLADRMSLAILYGSVAKHEDTASSDIDVLVVADDIRLEELYGALEVAENELGRRVSPTLYTRKEFDTRRRSGHAFVTKVFSGPHVILFGDGRGDFAAR